MTTQTLRFVSNLGSPTLCFVWLVVPRRPILVACVCAGPRVSPVALVRALVGRVARPASSRKLADWRETHRPTKRRGLVAIREIVAPVWLLGPDWFVVAAWSTRCILGIFIAAAFTVLLRLLLKKHPREGDIVQSQ